MKLKKKRIRFVVPVDFDYHTSLDLAEAIKSFRLDPCYQMLAGDWSFEMKRPYVLKPSREG